MITADDAGYCVAKSNYHCTNDACLRDPLLARRDSKNYTNARVRDCLLALPRAQSISTHAVKLKRK